MDGLIVGKIVNTHALKGELKVKNLSNQDRFYKGAKLFIEYKNEYIEVTVKSVREQAPLLLVVFENLLDINLVEKYKGCNIWIDKDSLTDLDDDEFYYYELIGLDVYNEQGQLKGVVESIREVPQGQLLVIDCNGTSNLVPFRKEFIVDVLEDRIIIHEIEGLL